MDGQELVYHAQQFNEGYSQFPKTIFRHSNLLDDASFVVNFIVNI